jgi:hypothetical protein
MEEEQGHALGHVLGHGPVAEVPDGDLAEALRRSLATTSAVEDEAIRLSLVMAEDEEAFKQDLARALAASEADDESIPRPVAHAPPPAYTELAEKQPTNAEDDEEAGDSEDATEYTDAVEAPPPGDRRKAAAEAAAARASTGD